MSALAAATILAGMGIEPILQITCRDKNRIALQSELMGAAALGIRNLLLLTGDDPKAGDQPDTKPVFDINSKTLIETARRLRDEGTLPTGRKVGGKAAFFLGAADVPIDPPADWQPNALLGKVKSGAQFVQTQFCMDAGIVRRYVGALEQAGLTQKLAILIGINPLRSAKSAAWMKSHLFGTIIPDALIKRMEEAADPEREGVRICADLIDELSDNSRRRRRPHHGAGQRCGDSRSDRRGEGRDQTAPRTRSMSAIGVGRSVIAAPGDMAVGPHQHQTPLVKRGGLGFVEIDTRQRHAARFRGSLQARPSRASPKRSSTKPRPNRSRVERPSRSQACGARLPGCAEGT